MKLIKLFLALVFLGGLFFAANNILKITVYDSVDPFSAPPGYPKNMDSQPANAVVVKMLRVTDSGAIDSARTNDIGVTYLKLTDKLVYFKGVKAGGTYVNSKEFWNIGEQGQGFYYNSKKDRICMKTTYSTSEKCYLPEELEGRTKLYPAPLTSDFLVTVISRDGAKKIENAVVGMYYVKNDSKIADAISKKDGTVTFSRNAVSYEQVYFVATKDGKEYLNPEGKKAVVFVNTGKQTDKYCRYKSGKLDQCGITGHRVAEKGTALAGEDGWNLFGVHDISKMMDEVNFRVKRKAGVLAASLAGEE